MMSHGRRIPDVFMTEDAWRAKYKPGPVLEELPKEGTFRDDHLWTEIETDGVFTIAAGNYLVNRTGRYYLSHQAHQHNVFVDAE